MDAWGSAPVTHSFCRHCWQALGDVFRAFENNNPWWVTIIHPVNGDDKKSLIYLLGFEHSVGMQFLCSAGLVKEGNSRNTNSFVIVSVEWEKFFIEQNLLYLVDGINRTAVSGCRYFFINFGSKSKLQHRPIDQYNGKVKLSKVGIYLSAHQRKLHKKSRIYYMICIQLINQRVT